jgi:O-antigen/teichoic acid export membrane protein
MREEGTARKVVRNTLFNYLAIICVTLIRFIAMPILIHGLGQDRYGIYATVMSVVGYVGLLDLGIGISLTKFVAEYYANRDFRRLNEMLSTSLLLYLGLGILGSVILVAFSSLFVQHVFNIPVSLWTEGRYVFWISALSLFNGLTLGIFGNLLNGIQRQDITRTITIGNALITYSGAILLVTMGYKLVAFMLFATLMDVLSFLVQLWIARRMLPEVRFFPRIFKKQELKQIVNFSFAMFINQLAARNVGVLDKLILGIFLPIANVTLYAVGYTLASFSFRIPSAAVLASLPAASELMAQGRLGAVHQLILRGMKYTGLMAIPIFTVMGVMAPDIVRLWMGEGYELSARVLQLLLAGYFWLALSSSGANVMIGIGKPYINTYYAVAQILLCSTLSIAMIQFFGVLGAAAGAAMAYTLGGTVYLLHSTHIFKIPFGRLVNQRVAGQIVLSLLPGILLGIHHHRSPPGGIWGILAQASLYGAVYGLLIVRYVVDDYDLEKISAVIPPVRHLSFLRRQGGRSSQRPKQ